MTSKAANSAVNGALEDRRMTASQDDFSVPSTTATEPENEERIEEMAAAKIEGLGISNTTVDPLFSQTKRSSDDLVASINGTPSPKATKGDQWASGDDSIASTDEGQVHDDSRPATPPPKKERVASEITPSPHRIPKYKIALAANILSPSRVASS